MFGGGYFGQPYPGQGYSDVSGASAPRITVHELTASHAGLVLNLEAFVGAPVEIDASAVAPLELNAAFERVLELSASAERTREL
jgi:hypothetical protein